MFRRLSPWQRNKTSLFNTAKNNFWRFSSTIQLPEDFNSLSDPTDEQLAMVTKATTINLKNTKEMIARYPHIMRRNFSGEVVYTLSQISPEQMMKEGGLIKPSARPWLANTGTGNNDGSVCFSLIPNVVAIFARAKPNFLYCLPLRGEFLIPGSQWREIIAPGALPAPSWWLCRPLIEVTMEKIILGPMMGRIAPKAQLILDQAQFEKFAGNNMKRIEAVDCGEDFPYHYLVEKEDSKASAQFEREVTEYYKKPDLELRSFNPSV